ncbi:hypothetical protein HPB51_015564 [Rhipicephalus microplus]|uniref:HTH CENPB-type domain-containing protein n=1 Tax=Rhipicephalus microplus TaxID=6941 RepID=A0A9J6DHG7_RHIMP|nr:hypothetical protein HPB51_015564 [Rhipicephalus microplus]
MIEEDKVGHLLKGIAEDVYRYLNAKDIQESDIPLSGPVILAKAADFALQLDYDDFAASDRWLHRFCERYNLVFRAVSGEMNAVNMETCEGAQGHNSLPPEHVGRRLQFVDSGAEPLEFDAATLRLPTSSLPVTTPPNVDFATECCRRGINDGPGYYPDDLNCAQGHNSLPPEHVGRRLQFVDSGAEPLEFDAATLRLPTSSLPVTTPPNVDFATECCRRGINDGPGYYPDDLNCRPNVLLIQLV